MTLFQALKLYAKAQPQLRPLTASEQMGFQGAGPDALCAEVDGVFVLQCQSNDAVEFYDAMDEQVFALQLQQGY